MLPPSKRGLAIWRLNASGEVSKRQVRYFLEFSSIFPDVKKERKKLGVGRSVRPSGRPSLDLD